MLRLLDSLLSSRMIIGGRQIHCSEPQNRDAEAAKQTPERPLCGPPKAFLSLQSHLRSVFTLQREPRLHCNGRRVATLQTLKALQNPHDHVGCLRKRKLLPDADPRATSNKMLQLV